MTSHTYTPTILVHKVAVQSKDWTFPEGNLCPVSLQIARISVSVLRWGLDSKGDSEWILEINVLLETRTYRSTIQELQWEVLLLILNLHGTYNIKWIAVHASRLTSVTSPFLSYNATTPVLSCPNTFHWSNWFCFSMVQYFPYVMLYWFYFSNTCKNKRHEVEFPPSDYSFPALPWHSFELTFWGK